MKILNYKIDNYRVHPDVSLRKVIINHRPHRTNTGGEII